MNQNPLHIEMPLEDCTCDQLALLGGEGYRLFGVSGGVVIFRLQVRMAKAPEPALPQPRPEPPAPKPPAQPEPPAPLAADEIADETLDAYSADSIEDLIGARA